MANDQTFQLDDLVTPLSREQILASIYRALGVLGVNTTNWKPGAVVRTMLVSVSVVLAGLSKLQAQIARSGFLELSNGKWLTLVARYVYGVERESASFASGPLRLTNTAGGVFEGDPGDLIVRDPVSGLTFRNTESYVLGAVGSGSAEITIHIEATEAGAASSCGPGAITEFVTTLNGVTITNTAAFVGYDVEGDTSLRQRCAEKLGALSPFGPWDAYASAVRNAKLTDGKKTAVNRIRLTKDGYGRVWVYCATSAGETSGASGDLTTDLGAADEAVQRLAAPLCITAFTESAIAKPVTFAYELWMYSTSGRSPAQIEAAVAKRLGEFFAAQPLGGNTLTTNAIGEIYVEAIKAAIISTFPEIFRCEVTGISADELKLQTNEVAVLQTVAATAIHQVSPPEGLAVAA